MMRRLFASAFALGFGVSTAIAGGPTGQPILASQLPPAGTAGTPAPLPGFMYLPTKDKYGRIIGDSSVSFSAYATPGSSGNGTFAGIGGSIPVSARTAPAHFFDHFNVKDGYAVCDGNIDDAVALNQTLNATYHVELPNGTCAFKSKLTIRSAYVDVQGSGKGGGSRLLYTGTDTTTDLIQVGSGTTSDTGVTSQGHITLSKVLIESTTKMTAGAAIHQQGTQFIQYNDVALGRQGDPFNLWNGYLFEQNDHTEVNDPIVFAQNECVGVFGHGAEGSPATGPQYELYMRGAGKISGCHIALHVGGGFDGAMFDGFMITNVDYDAVVDNALAAHPNQSIVFGPNLYADFARFDSFLINDTLCAQRIQCMTTIMSPTLHAGNNGSGAAATTGVSTGSFASTAPPANSLNSIHVKSYPGGYVHVLAPMLRGAFNAGIYIEDQSAFLTIDKGTAITNAPLGIYSTAAFTNMQGLPSFIAITGRALTNVASTIPAFITLSGSGTYTPSGSTASIKVSLRGGGTGGAGSGTGAANGALGGNTTFGSLTAVGGTGASGSTGAVTNVAASGGDVNLQGGGGGDGITGVAGMTFPGGPGGLSPGGPQPGRPLSGKAGGNGLAGGGGAGGGGSGAMTSGGGGGGGNYIEKTISPVAPSYAYSVGAGGAGGAAGTSGFAGGNGGAGALTIEERY